MDRIYLESCDALGEDSNLKVFVVAVGFLAFRGGPAGLPGEIGAILLLLPLVWSHIRGSICAGAREDKRCLVCEEQPMSRGRIFFL